MSTDVWIGGAGNGNLDDPRNWSLSRVPIAGDTASFTASAAVNEGNICRPEMHFSPTTVTVAPGTQVLFQGPQVWRFNTVDIGYRSTMSVVGGAMTAETVHDAGQLDLSKAGMLGFGPFVTTSSWEATAAAALRGFGDVPLSAVIRNLDEVDTGFRSYPPGPLPITLTGDVSYGDRMAAIYSISETYPHGADMSSFYTSMPTVSGIGGPKDTAHWNVGPGYQPDIIPGYDGTSAAYDHTLANLAYGSNPFAIAAIMNNLFF